MLQRSPVIDYGEFGIIPEGVEHRSVADQEVQVMLTEPASTLNTVAVRNERIVDDPERLVRLLRHGFGRERVDSAP